MTRIAWEPLAKQLAHTVAETGALSDPAWRLAFEQTPRHLFVPRYWALNEYNLPADLVNGDDPGQQQRWLDAVYRNDVLITQWQPQTEGELRIVTSSASLPSLVAHMLKLLDITDGRVLEIGTGTGYNTALLCHRLGNRVATIDLDPTLVAEAHDRLRRLGHQPTTAVGDGALGMPQAAPFDRILCTCSAATVPPAWIDQLNNDGLIVAPLTFGGALAVLRKTGPGQVTGRLDSEQAYFMPLRPPDAALPYGFLTDLPPDERQVRHTSTDLDLPTWADPDWRLWLALHLPEAHYADRVSDDGTRTGMVVYNTTSRATVDYTTGHAGAWSVSHDTSALWDTVEAAWQAWQRAGRPDRTRIGITAHADGDQHAWLDHPDSPHRWPLLPASRS